MSDLLENQKDRLARSFSFYIGERILRWMVQMRITTDSCKEFDNKGSIGFVLQKTLLGKIHMLLKVHMLRPERESHVLIK